MRVLAVDLGTNCGLAWADDGVLNPLNVKLLKTKGSRYEGAGMRFVRFTTALARLKPTYVYFEEVRNHKGTEAGQIYGGFLGALAQYCERADVPYQGVQVGTIKKHATGKGNSGKEVMIARARSRLGYLGDDDNEADAIWILHYALNELLHKSQLRG